MALTAALRNFKETGSVLNIRQWPLFTENIYELAVSDALMSATTALSLPLHFVFKKSKGWLRWSRGGMAVQSVYQSVWLLFWCSWPFVRDWTWTAQVFFTLHLLALFMKMHSYAFYNGHLSTTLNRLKELDDPIRAKTPTPAAVRYPHSFERLADIKAEGSEDDNQEEIPPIQQLREDLATELTSPMGRVTYPQNLTLWNYWDYLLCPTLCYELEYPRLERTNPLELFYKTLAVFGCIFLMTITSEEFIIPVLHESSIRLQSPDLTYVDRGLVFAETVSHLLFPFMVTFLLVFLVIFEYVLGAFAEITRFADRRFYADWWNSLDWLEFSREWNIPVHHFFRRHVYSASRTTMSRPFATVTTFLISSLAHELVMGCITRKFRGYGFFMMMMQMPIVMVQRLPWVRRRTLLNNVLFWCSMILGLSLVSITLSATYKRAESILLTVLVCRCVRFTCLFRYPERRDRIHVPTPLIWNLLTRFHCRCKERIMTQFIPSPITSVGSCGGRWMSHRRKNVRGNIHVATVPRGVVVVHFSR